MQNINNAAGILTAVLILITAGQLGAFAPILIAIGIYLLAYFTLRITLSLAKCGASKLYWYYKAKKSA